VVHLIRLNLLHNPNEVAGVTQVAIVQYEIAMIYMWVLVKMINPVRVEEAGTTLNPVDNVALFKQKFSKI
ncbi:MAG: hypothetical protein RLZ63_1663, partial [Pseudomonadota bacterium]